MTRRCLRGLTVIVLALICVPLAARADDPARGIIRTVTGVRYECPAGWALTEFGGYSATFRHIATTVGDKGKESSPNTFSMGTRTVPDDALDRGWDTVDRADRRTFPGGATAVWKTGKRWSMHYVFAGEIVIAKRVLEVSLLDTPTPKFAPRLVEAAFLAVAESVREVPETNTLFHPFAGIASDKLPSDHWYNEVTSNGIDYGCFESFCGKASNTWITTYPTGAFPSLTAALADITGYFEKSASLKIGETRHEEASGVQIVWTEQPGSRFPFLGVALRDSHGYFVRLEAAAILLRSHEQLREDFLRVAKSVKDWDGK